MGADSKLYISRKFDNAQVVNLIHNTYMRLLGKRVELPPVKISEVDYGDVFYMYYRLDEGLKLGQLMVFKTEVGGIPSLGLMARKDKKVIKFFKEIGKRVGGILIEDDCVDDSIILDQEETLADFDFLVKDILTLGAHYDDNSIKKSIHELEELLKDKIL